MSFLKDIVKRNGWLAITLVVVGLVLFFGSTIITFNNEQTQWLILTYPLSGIMWATSLYTRESLFSKMHLKAMAGWGLLTLIFGLIFHFTY